MKVTKKWLALFLALAMCLSLAACGGGGDDAQNTGSGSGGQQTSTGGGNTGGGTENVDPDEIPFDENGHAIEGYNYGLNFAYIVNWAPAEYFQDSFGYFSNALEKLGCTMDLLGESTNYSVEAQIEIMENAIASGKYDAFLIYPDDLESMRAVCQEARDAGIPTMTIGVPGDGLCDYGYSLDNYAMGWAIAEMAIDWVNQHRDHFGDTVTVAVEHNYGNPESEARGQAQIDCFNAETAKGDVTYVIIEKQAGTYDEGYEWGENIAVSNPECEIMVAHGDDPAVGCATAWAAMGRDLTYCATFGMDSTDMALAAIQDGTAFRGTIYGNIALQCKEVPTYLIKMALGLMGDAPSELPPPDAIKVTAANIDEILAEKESLFE